MTHFLLEENLEFRLKLAAAKAALGFQVCQKRPIKCRKRPISVKMQLAAAKAALGFQVGMCLVPLTATMCLVQLTSARLQRPIIGVHVRNGEYCSFENDQVNAY